jgi:hypothetical protein
LYLQDRKQRGDNRLRVGRNELREIGHNLAQDLHRALTVMPVLVLAGGKQRNGKDKAANKNEMKKLY